MPNNPLSKKLGFKSHHRVLVINAPEGYTHLLGPLPEGIELVNQPTGTFDAVHLFVRNKAELEQHAAIATQSLKPDGLLWISYPKRSSKVDTDITRDVGWEVIDKAGLSGVAQVAVDDVWSALRFRPKKEIERDG